MNRFGALLLLGLCCYLSTRSLVAASSSHDTEDPESDYLYENHFPPVVDFLRKEFKISGGDLDSAVTAYLEGADKEGTAKRKAQFEEKMRHPSFLFGHDNVPRVVEFYAPWCPHCQEFKSHYVDLARQITSMPGGSDIKFHAVSCTAHRSICKDFDIRAYPRVLLLKSGSNEGVLYKKSEVSIELILDNFGIVKSSKNSKLKESVAGQSETDSRKKYTKKQTMVSKGKMTRSKEDIYKDASLSFDFALRNAIYMGNGPLPKHSTHVLDHWLDLLRKTIPMDMSLTHKQIGALIGNFQQVVANEENLIKALEDLEPEDSTWSISCTHGKEIGGYTCGLWELFHIMTVGLAEWNIGAPKSLRVSTNSAAETLRSYIEQFFGCELCQANFIQAYDSCSRDRCNRLNDKTDTATISDWRELSLWLWETHNDVNVRLLNERAVQESKPSPSADEQKSVMWPSKDDCLHCWRDDGSWNEDVVYSYLRLEYWPDDDRSEQHRKIQRLDPTPEDEPFELEDNLEGPYSTKVYYGVPAGALSLFGVWMLYQKKEKDRTGRHKKRDYSQHGLPNGRDTYFSDRV